MNRSERRALFDDALYQVLDNMVFRILAVLIVLLVVPTFLFGFREDQIVFLFWVRFDYPEWLRQIAPQLGGDVQSATVNGLQSAFIDSIAGGVGMLFCIVATSFFMPRMLEKGYADTVFSKPASRLALLLSRYVAGILFVGLLAVVLVGGQTLGFQLVSGYSDPGFLFSVFTLIWLFMMLHAVSLLCGVLTRSAIAAVMITIVFYAVCGSMHTGWRIKEQWREEHERKLAALIKEGKPTDEVEVAGRVVKALLVGLDIGHFVLPKTSDAELIAKLFRRQFESATRELVDEETGVSIAAAPRDFAREPRSSLRLPEGLLWIAPHPAGGGEARWTLKRQSVAESKSRSTLVKELKKELAANPACTEVDSQRTTLGMSSADRVEWREKRGDEQRVRRRWFFVAPDWMLTLDYDAEAGWGESEAQKRSHDRFLAGIAVGEARQIGAGMIDPHTRDFGWTADWRSNAWFSLASTAAFIVATLAFATWRLKRIDF